MEDVCRVRWDLCQGEASLSRLNLGGGLGRAEDSVDLPGDMHTNAEWLRHVMFQTCYV